MKISSRSQTAPFIAMDVLAEAQAIEARGGNVIHMEVGEPAYGAPKAAREALAAALGRGDALGYTSGLGLAALRQGIAALYQRRYGLEIDPERVVVTSGSSGGFMLSFLALFDPGERVAIADPGYPCYRNILGTLGLEPVRIEAELVSRYQPTPALLDEVEGPLHGLLVASPANPTGTMLDKAALGALATYCQDRGVALISDEIYHGLTYDTPAVSALELTDQAFVINSFSKYYAMTGWRIGWLVVPDRFVRTLQNLAQNLFICPSHASQIAALAALSDEAEEEVARHLDEYAYNRAAVMSALPKLGFTDISPADGAFYAYAGVSRLTNDSRDFCARLLTEGGVAATPGLDFDPARGHTTMRFSFAQPRDKIAEGITRLTRFIESGG
ncbi:MAG: aminotransferase class I/II-fold pyridoxal phosphate-dependent enzyme [Paracoccaceae bacterium]|nr:aminotransferase class I/II-fold pyridoxal phosphate-dependent enzyme [Paracoccaceae bacterium]